MARRGKNTAQSGADEGTDRIADRAGKGRLRSAREQVVFLYFLIVFVLVSVYLDRGSALPYAQTGIPMHAG